MEKEIPIEINVKHLKKLRDNGIFHTVLDVREPDELEIFSLSNTLNIPMNDIPGNITNLPKNGSLIVMCHSGRRSMQITKWLRTNGFAHAQNLTGGINAWSSAFEANVN